MIETITTSKEFENNLNRIIEIKRKEVGTISKMIPLDLESYDFDAKSAVFSHIVSEDETNFRGTMHGGIISWLADTCMGSVTVAYVRTDNPTIDMNLRFIKPIYPGDRLLIKASLNSVGGHIVTTECKMYVCDGSKETLVSTATGSFYRLDKVLF